MKRRPLMLLWFASAAIAQQLNTGSATSHGKCSPPVTGNKNTVIVHCDDLQSREDLRKLLQAVHDSKASTQQILSKLDQMTETLKGRHLTVEQIRKFSEILKPMAGYRASITCAPSDDSCSLAEDIATAFNNAGWRDGSESEDEVRYGILEHVRARRNYTPGNDFVGMRVHLDPKWMEGSPAGETMKQFLPVIRATGYLTAEPEIKVNENFPNVPLELFIAVGTKPR